MAVVDIYNTDNKYSVIYADAPWKYENSLDNNPKWGGITYNTMALEDICALPVEKLADKDCVLFMWATMPKLREALTAIKAWGFEYKTCAFCWVKQNPNGEGIYSGLGRWVNGNAELCLLATKGHPKRQAKNIKQILFAPRGRHSAKPPETRKRIEKLVGGAKIELFAREQVDGWDCWGNEVCRYKQESVTTLIAKSE